MNKRLFLTLLLFPTLLFARQPQAGRLTLEQKQQLIDRREAVRKWAVECPESSGPYAGQMTHTDGHCLQGDMVFTAGLSCLAAVLAEDTETASRRCSDVALSQDASGRFWRGPSLIGVPYDPSFSRDQFRGVLAYHLAYGKVSKDIVDREEAWNSAKRYQDWIASHNGKLCTDDTRTCEFTVGTENLAFNVWRQFDALPEETGPTADLARSLRKSQWYLPKGIQASALASWFDATFRDKHYPANLQAVAILLMRVMNMNDDFTVRNRHIAVGLGRAARTLHRLYLDNPFFDFLRNGIRPDHLVPEVLSKTFEEMPQPEVNWRDWWVQRTPKEEAWLRSDGWTDIFLIDLILAMDSGRLVW